MHFLIFIDIIILGGSIGILGVMQGELVLLVFIKRQLNNDFLIVNHFVHSNWYVFATLWFLFIIFFISSYCALFGNFGRWFLYNWLINCTITLQPIYNVVFIFKLFPEGNFIVDNLDNTITNFITSEYFDEIFQFNIFICVGLYSSSFIMETLLTLWLYPTDNLLRKVVVRRQANTNKCTNQFVLTKWSFTISVPG